MHDIVDIASLIRPRAIARAGGYTLFATAGIIATMFGPLSLVAVMGETWATVWGVWLTVGGLACLLGVITGTWVGEFVGIHLLGSALTGYAVAVATYTDSPLGPWRWGGACLLVAICGGLLDRWLDVASVAGIHRRIPKG